MTVTSFRSVMEFWIHLDTSSSHLDSPFVQNSPDISQFKPVYRPDYTGRLKHKYYVILLMSNIWQYFSWHLTIIKVKLHVVWSFAYVCCPPQHVYTCSPLRVKNRYRGAAYVNGYDISLKIYKSPLLFSVLCYCDRNSCYNDVNTVEGHIILQRHRLNSHSI